MKISESAQSLLWKLFLLVLPISSFPLLSRLMGGASVAPLAAVPMLLLLIIWWLPSFFKNGFKLPYQVKPLLLYFLFGLFTTLFISFRDVPTFQSASIPKSVLEVIITFGMGIGFYLVTVHCVRNEKNLRTTVLWINISGIIVMAYSLLQVLIWYLLGHYPEWLYGIQRIFSSNAMLFSRRATGLAFEPSWLAHQLNMVFIPIWLAMSVTGYSIFKRKLFNKIQIEKVLLACSIATLFITLSRIGWITFFIVIAYLAIRFYDQLINKLSVKSSKSPDSKPHGFWFRFGMWAGLILGMLALVFLAGLVLSYIDPRMRDLFDLKRLIDAGFMRWASKLVFLERVMYWIAAYRVFQMFPFMGAGFGIPGFFFQKTVPVYGSQLLDVNDFLLKPFFLPNAKNFWVRILSETGIIGFAPYASWVVIHWRDAAELERKTENKMLQTMGLAGKIIVISMIIEGFSLDSFGLPYVWVALGLLSATWFISRDADAQAIGTAQTSGQ